MDRLIIESVEGRITLGIVMFVAIMILTGWIAINEPARMAEFVEQHEGRSIERGAELFAANCSSCHGINGLGNGGRAPALNNPQLFGFSYLGDVNAEIASLQRNARDIIGTPDQAGTRALVEQRRDALLSAIAEASEDEVRDLVVELLDAEARLLDDSELVAERIAAIEAGEPGGDDADPELSNRELESRLLALQDNIPNRLADIEARLEGDDGLLAQREVLLADLEGARLSGYLPRLDEERASAEENNDPFAFTTYIEQDSDRLKQIGFGGSLEGYIATTLIHGRPGSGDVWNGNIMVSWSQRAGGPLRDDQIEDLVSYITNWDKGDDWSPGDFDAVNQYAIIHAQYRPPRDGEEAETTGTNVEEILAGLPAGDAANGEQLYNGAVALEAVPGVLGCAGCHVGGAVGPDLAGTWTRVETQRLTLPEFADYTGEQYLIESIVNPNAFVVSGFSGGVMIGNYGDQLTAQELADIIAFLQTQTD